MGDRFNTPKPISRPVPPPAEPPPPAPAQVEPEPQHDVQRLDRVEDIVHLHLVVVPEGESGAILRF